MERVRSRAKEYLMQLQATERMIDRKLVDRARLMALLTRATPLLQEAGGFGGGNGDRLGSGVARLADLDAEIDREIDGLVDRKRDAERLLRRVANLNSRHYEILCRRYIAGETFEEIAQGMGYTTVRGATMLHGRALQTFEQVMKEAGVGCR